MISVLASAAFSICAASIQQPNRYESFLVGFFTLVDDIFERLDQ